MVVLYSVIAEALGIWGLPISSVSLYMLLCGPRTVGRPGKTTPHAKVPIVGHYTLGMQLYGWDLMLWVEY